jgi:hypothetical protein
LALGNSINRRLAMIGFKPKKRQDNLDDYIRTKERALQ